MKVGEMLQFFYGFIHTVQLGENLNNSVSASLGYGVPQGSFLRPIWFPLYVLSHIIHDVSFQVYANKTQTLPL